MPPRPVLSSLIDQADAAGVALFAATVALPEDGSAPEWVTVFPKVGRVETRDGRAFEVSAATLMAAFADDAIKIPVDVNHATDAAGLFGGEAPAVGWGVELREQDGGLQLKVEWLDRGRELLAARQYLYTSPSFFQDHGRATRLKALALVTSPALARQPALAHATLARAGGPTPEPPMTPIATALGLPEGADEAACLAAIATLKTGQGELVAQLQAQLSTASSRLAAVEKANRDRQVSALIEGALKDRKIVPAQREHLEKLCATDDGLAGVTAMLAATAPNLQPSGLDARRVSEGGAILDSAQLAAAAQTIQDEHRAAGRPISFADAMTLATAKAPA